MIFSVQHYLEDYFHQRNLSDLDQYAVKLANLYARRRQEQKDAEFLRSMRRIQTIFYKNNSAIDRLSVERQILKRLDKKFKKKASGGNDPAFPGGVAPERAALRSLPRRSIGHVLQSFKHAVEARAVGAIWESRAKGRLRPRPEKVAQAILAAFAMGVLSNGKGQLLREFASGVGFVDVGIIFGSVMHLVEMKVLQRGRFTGVSQLTTYMRTEQRPEGWLVVFDARARDKRGPLPSKIDTLDGTVRVLLIELNPLAPSKLKRN